jgi:hypothetical protein
MHTIKRNFLKPLLIWRAKYITQRQFIYIVSILVGFTSGIGAVILKNLTHFYQHLLEGNLVKYYHQAFYFVFPIIGLTLVYFTITYIIRHKVSHGISSTLFAFAKHKGLIRKYQMFGSILTAPLAVEFAGSVGLERRKGELITHDKDHAILTMLDVKKVLEDNFIKLYPEMSLGEMVHQAVVKTNRNIFPVVNKVKDELLC